MDRDGVAVACPGRAPLCRFRHQPGEAPGPSAEGIGSGRRPSRHRRHCLGGPDRAPQDRRSARSPARTWRPARSSQSLECGDQAYPQMLAAIESAKFQVRLSTYIFRTDDVGLQFIDALVRAHRRGVRTRVLIDGFGGGFLRSSAYHALRRQGVPVARFLHSTLPWKMPFLDLRLHKKSLVVDGRARSSAD